MIYLNVFGQHFIILSSLQVTKDLLEKRSSNYSDRMHMTMLNELYVSLLYIKELIKNARSMQNELEHKPSPYPIRPVVAKT